MRLLKIAAVGFFSLISVLTCLASPPKVIIDTDFNTIGDDGQVGAMAAQLFAQGTIDLLGFTIASGNEWRDQEVAECLKAVERSCRICQCIKNLQRLGAGYSDKGIVVLSFFTMCPTFSWLEIVSNGKVESAVTRPDGIFIS